jgi:hypothetical protein
MRSEEANEGLTSSAPIFNGIQSLLDSLGGMLGQSLNILRKAAPLSRGIRYHQGQCTRKATIVNLSSQTVNPVSLRVLGLRSLQRTSVIRNTVVSRTYARDNPLPHNDGKKFTPEGSSSFARPLHAQYELL